MHDAGRLGVVPILLDSTTPTSARDQWCTPPWLLDIVRGFKPIYCDPCDNADSFVRPLYTNPNPDGLAFPWPREGLIWVNPPYSKGNYLKFCKKMHEEADRGAEIIALVPANVETKPWQKYLWEADAWCFPKHRINFYIDGQERRGVNFASALVYFGLDSRRFVMHFEQLGHTLRNSAH